MMDTPGETPDGETPTPGGMTPGMTPGLDLIDNKTVKIQYHSTDFARVLRLQPEVNEMPGITQNEFFI